MEVDIVCEGYLTKAPPINQPRSKWYRRYFTLDKLELVLKYYKDKDTRYKRSSKKNDNAKGEIRLITVHQINESSDHALDNNYRHGFELETEKRTWVLIADTEKDMVHWLSCLKSVFSQSKRTTIVGSPNPGGSPRRSTSVLKKVRSQMGKIQGPGAPSKVGAFESIREDSSSSSIGDETSQFDEDDEETMTHSKSVSSHMSSADSAIGSEKSSKVRLTDGLPVSEPLYDEIAQKEWMMKTNQRNAGDKVSLHISTTTDNLLPSQDFIMRSQIGSPTLGRTNVDGVYMFDQESEIKTPGGDQSPPEGFYDFPTNIKKRAEEEAEPMYDTPSALSLTSVISVRKVETVTKEGSIADEDLYDIPSNVIKSLQSDKSTNSLYDSLAPAEQTDTTHPQIEDIYDVPVLRKPKTPCTTDDATTTEVDGQQGGAAESPAPEAIYDTPPSKSSSVSSYTVDFNPPSRRATGTSNTMTNFSSTSSRTTSVSSINHTTTMLCREDSIDSAYQLLIIEDKKEESNEVVPIEEEESVYNIPPARPVPQPVPQPVFQPQQVLLLPPRIEARPGTPPSNYHDIIIPNRHPPEEPTPPPVLAPVLPPRTDRPPVPTRGQTLGRPSRTPPEDVKPARPQSDVICRPNRPVPQPPSAEREPVHFELTRSGEAGAVGSHALTRAKINERDHQDHILDRRAAPPDNEYIDVRQTPIPIPSPSPLRDHTPPAPDRATPPPLAPRSSIPPRAPTVAQTSPRTISAGIGLSTISAAFGAPFTPPKLPQRSGTIAGSTTVTGMPQRADTLAGSTTVTGMPQRAGTLAGSTTLARMPQRSSTTTNPFLEGFVPQREMAATMSRLSLQPRQLGHGVPNKSATLSTSKVPGMLNLSMNKQAQDEYDAIPDTPSPSDEITRPAAPLPAISVSASGNSKYPTIKNTNIGMEKVKQGYQNVTEVKQALKSRGSSVKGESHGKLHRREVPARHAPTGYTPMDTMQERMKKAAVAAEKQGYEPMLSQQQRMANYNAQLQQNPRPLPPRTLAVDGDTICQASQHSPEYVDRNFTHPAPSPIYIEPEELQQEMRRPQADDITQLPEYIRMGEIDMTLNQEDYLPMSLADQDQYLSMANWQDEYQSMEALGQQSDYLAMDPQDDYLAMGRSPHDDYLAMERNPQEDYLAMGRNPEEDYLAMGRSPQQDYLAMVPQASGPGAEYNNTSSGDNFSNLTFSNS